MDVIATLEAVLQEVRDARPVPFSASAIIDRKDLLERLDELAKAIPGELKKARWIIEDRDEVLARIQQDAQETLERARQERDRMLSRPEVENAASLEADRVIEMAKVQAREIRLEAEHFVDGKLASLEVALQKMLGLVHSASASFVDRSGAGLRPAPKRPAAGGAAGSGTEGLFAPGRPNDRLDIPRGQAKQGDRSQQGKPPPGSPGPARERGPRAAGAPPSSEGSATRSLGLGTPGTRPNPARPLGQGAGASTDRPVGQGAGGPRQGVQASAPQPPPASARDGDTTAELTRRAKIDSGSHTGPQERLVVDLRDTPQPPSGEGAAERHESEASPEGPTPLF